MVLIDSVSKRYSECGIRIGALITKNRALHDAVMKFCQASLFAIPMGFYAGCRIDSDRFCAVSQIEITLFEVNIDFQELLA